MPFWKPLSFFITLGVSSITPLAYFSKYEFEWIDYQNYRWRYGSYSIAEHEKKDTGFKGKFGKCQVATYWSYEYMAWLFKCPSEYGGGEYRVHIVEKEKDEKNSALSEIIKQARKEVLKKDGPIGFELKGEQ